MVRSGRVVLGSKSRSRIRSSRLSNVSLWLNWSHSSALKPRMRTCNDQQNIIHSIHTHKHHKSSSFFFHFQSKSCNKLMIKHIHHENTINHTYMYITRITLQYHTLHYNTIHTLHTSQYITTHYIHYITLHTLHTSQYITTHYIHYNTLHTLYKSHYITLQPITLHYNTIHYNTIHTLHTLQYITYITHITLHDITTHYITLQYTHYITLPH